MSSIQLPLPFPPEEEWRDIPGFSRAYQVSNTGLVRRGFATTNKKAYELMAIRIGGSGYSKVVLRIKDKSFTRSIHRLVMLAFIGECPDGYEVNHINGIKADNRLENLEYCTHRENVNHSINVLGYTSIGIKNPAAKLTEDQVREIRRIRRELGTSILKLAKQFNISFGMVNHILSRRCWKHIE